MGDDLQELQIAIGKTARLVVKDAKRADDVPGRRPKRRAGIKPYAVLPQKWIVGKSRVARYVLYNERNSSGDHMATN